MAHRPAAPTGSCRRSRWHRGPACWTAPSSAAKRPQAGIAPPPRAELADFSGAPDPSPETEDCLNLNVWTPATDAARRPVMVWFHGGAFSWGNSNAPRVWGHRLARKHDVVVVTVNQRLNIFGHLDLSAVGGEAYRHSGNAGTLDMIAALEWVRDNIARFGGDPGNVTIFGESGGGAKVAVLLTMPRAVGLFHRGIIQSGAVVRLRTRERALALTGHVMRHLGAASVSDLQAVPVTDLLAAIKPAQAALGASPYPLFDRYAFGPVVDGDIVPVHPFDPGASTVQPDIPIIIGDMKQETANFLAPVDEVWNRTLTREDMLHRVAPIAGKHTGRVIELYDRLCHGMNPAEELIAITTRQQFPHPLLGPGAAPGRAGARQGVDVFLRVGNAGVRGPPRCAARDGRAVHLQHARPDQRDRRCTGGRGAVGHHGRALVQLRPHGAAGASSGPSLAPLRHGRAVDARSSIASAASSTIRAAMRDACGWTSRRLHNPTGVTPPGSPHRVIPLG